MNIHSIDAGLFKLDGRAMHGVVPKSMWSKVNTPDENNMCTWSMRCLLVQDGDRNILIDTGMGNKQNDKFFSYFHPHGDGDLLRSVQNVGLDATDITDVFLTHLHFDHCGGAVQKDGSLLFPNAKHWTNKKHWELALKPNPREKASFLKENILPIEESGKLAFLNGVDGELFTDKIEIRIVNGHTESMMLPLIHINGEKILFTADLLPSKPHISLPWVMGYDMQPLETLKEKERILNEAFEKNWVLFFEHDAYNECCRLEQTERGLRGGTTFSLDSLS